MKKDKGSNNVESTINIETLTKNITYCVENDERFQNIFSEFPHEINFESEMLIVYITTNIYMGNAYKLINLTVQDSILNVKIKRDGRYKVAHAASAPRQRCFVIKMDKQNITKINFVIE